MHEGLLHIKGESRIPTEEDRTKPEGDTSPPPIGVLDSLH